MLRPALRFPSVAFSHSLPTSCTSASLEVRNSMIWTNLIASSFLRILIEFRRVGRSLNTPLRYWRDSSSLTGGHPDRRDHVRRAQATRVVIHGVHCLDDRVLDSSFDQRAEVGDGSIGRGD